MKKKLWSHHEIIALQMVIIFTGLPYFAVKSQTVELSWGISISALGKFSQRCTARPPRLPSKPTSKCFKDMETISLAKLLASKTCFRKKTFATFSFFSGRSNFNGGAATFRRRLCCQTPKWPDQLSY